MSSWLRGTCVIASSCNTILRHSLLFDKLMIPCGGCLSRRYSTKEKRAQKKILIQESVFDYESKNKAERLYAWGNCSAGSLGASKLLIPNNPNKSPRRAQMSPYNLSFFKENSLKVKRVGCGYGFTVFGMGSISKDSPLYGTGINTDSQIGFQKPKGGRPLDYLIQPVPINLPLEQNIKTFITHVACGRTHTVVVTSDQGMFTLGNNSNGQCCRPIIDGEIYSASPLIHKVSFEHEIKQVVCGADHTLVLTSEGHVYSAGLGSDGQTGLGTYDSVGKLTRVLGELEGRNIAYISCRADNVLAVDDEGEVFGWGNSEYNQLSCVVGAEMQVNTPRHLHLREYVGRVVHVASAGSTCALVNDEGDVYVWGYGLLGMGPKRESSSMPARLPPTLFGRNEFSPDIRVLQVYAGMNFFATVNNIGELHTWGRNKHGVLGLGNKADQFFPFKVCLPAEVEHVHCGADHMMVQARSFS